MAGVTPKHCLLQAPCGNWKLFVSQNQAVERRALPDCPPPSIPPLMVSEWEKSVPHVFSHLKRSRRRGLAAFQRKSQSRRTYCSHSLRNRNVP